MESDPLRFVGFRALFDAETDLELLSATVSDLATRQDVDLVLLGSRNGQNLFDVMATLKASRPDLRIIVTGTGAAIRSGQYAVIFGWHFCATSTRRWPRRSSSLRLFQSTWYARC